MNAKFYQLSNVVLERSLKVLIPSAKADETNEQVSKVVATAAHLLLSRGFIMSDRLATGLLYASMDAKEVAEYCTYIIATIDEMYGNHTYKPFYKGFPDEVMNMDDTELVLNAILHYLSGGKIIPADITDVKENLYDVVSKHFDAAFQDVKVLDACSMDDVQNMAINLMSANTSITDTDKSFISLIANIYPMWIPENIPHKENKAIVIATMLENGIYEHPLYLQTNSATDILRVAVALSGGDVSLKESTYFKSFKRPIRKWIMDSIECLPGCIEEDMIQYRERWLRIGEIVHPGSYKVEEYERTINAFKVLRNQETLIRTYGSKLNHAFIMKRYDKVIDLLRSKPGYFARELNHAFKVFPEKQYQTALSFASVADHVATPVLLQVKAYYSCNQNVSDVGIYFPKGNTQNVYINLDKTPVALADEVKQVVLIACNHGLVSQYKARYADEVQNLKVYIPDVLDNYAIPTSMRSASQALRTLTRGSKVIMEDADYFRAFMHWKNCPGERTDIDLSVAFLDNDYNLITTVSYYNMRTEFACHSGDYVDAPDGADEFVDVNVNATKSIGARYLALCVNAFTMNKFRDVPECHVGYMTLTKEEYSKSRPRSPYKIHDVKMNMQLANDAQMVVVCLFDVVEKKVIWADLATDIGDTVKVTINNVDTHVNVLSYIARSVVEMRKISMRELAVLNTEAKGYTIADNPDEADIVYCVEPPTSTDKKTISVYDIDEWVAMV